ncbi:MAG: hypothetical protein WBE26_07580, partial [Phycisphaerae bacterium]
LQPARFLQVIPTPDAHGMRKHDPATNNTAVAISTLFLCARHARLGEIVARRFRADQGPALR